MLNSQSKDTASTDTVSRFRDKTPFVHTEMNKAVTLPATTNTEGVFLDKPFNEWLEEASTKPAPAMLLDEFWHEGEICILFAPTNVGKSVLAVQAGNSIASGIPITGLQMTASPQVVVCFDFELSAKQIEKRYSNNYTDHYQFSPNFIRVEMNTYAPQPEGKKFEEHIIEEMENLLNRHGAKVLILDNLTYLNANNETAKEAGPLMIALQGLKRKMGLSMLIMGHTPKRDQSRSITLNDLQGSSRLAQLADSIFAIGASAKDSGLRYLKQLKVRAVPFRYDAENIIVCQLHQPNNFLHFAFIGYGSEEDHLKAMNEDEKADRSLEILNLKRAGKNQAEIASQLKISQSTVSRALQNDQPKKAG